MTEDAYQEMLSIDLTNAIVRFQKKSADYGDAFKDLGIAGQYSDIHRKVRKLKMAMWEGKALEGEPPSEILEDLIGNCLISLWLYRQYTPSGVRSNV